MAALPYIQLYVADYLADTAHLNAAQHGAYLLLIMNYWQRGEALNNSNERLTNVARMSNEEWMANKSLLQEFFEIDGDTWVHWRIEADLEAVRDKSSKASNAGKASAKQRLNGRSTDVQQTLNHTDTDTDTDTDTESLKQKDLPPPCPPAFGVVAPPLPGGHAIPLGEPGQKRGEGKKTTKPHLDAEASLLELGIDPQVAKDFISVRKARKAPLTKTAIKGLQIQADKAGITFNEVLKICCERGWQGFNAEWESRQSRSAGALSTPSPASDGDENIPDGFQEFWEAYPNKIKKGPAIAAWNVKKISTNQKLQARILTALRWQIDCEKWRENNGQYIPEPGNYLTDQRWTDEKKLDAYERFLNQGNIIEGEFNHVGK